MPKPSTFTTHIASQMVDSDTFPFMPNAGGNGKITVSEFRDVVGLGWGFTINAARFAGISDEAKIQAAIDHAVNVSALRVFVPSSMLPYDASAVTFHDAVQMVREGGSFDVYDIMAYGAAGDGAADDTIAIQATLDACNAAGGGLVYCPAGTYIISTLAWPGNNISFIGAGSAYAYNTTATIRTKFKAKAGLGTANLIDLVVTGDVNDRTGCLLSDFEVDGDLEASHGIRCSAANLIQRVRVRGCLNTGILLANFTNATRIMHCGLVDNFGWGLRVEGSSTTTYSVVESNIALNQLGGMLLEAGVLARFDDVVCESNVGPGVRIYRPSGMTGAFVGLAFNTCWFEDNGATAGYTLEIDALTRSEANAPSKIHFFNCRINPSVATRKHMNIACAKWVTFEECQFDASTEAATLAWGTDAMFVALIESTRAVGTDYLGLTDAQVDSGIASGSPGRCYASDRESKRAVAGGIGFANSWTNFGSPYSDVKYWFDREGYVCISGAIHNGTIGVTAFTLPLGYRPPATMDFAVESNSSHGICRIEADGDVIAYVGSNGIFNFTGIRFATG